MKFCYCNENKTFLPYFQRFWWSWVFFSLSSLQFFYFYLSGKVLTKKKCTSISHSINTRSDITGVLYTHFARKKRNKYFTCNIPCKKNSDYEPDVIYMKCYENSLENSLHKFMVTPGSTWWFWLCVITFFFIKCIYKNERRKHYVSSD